MRKVSPETGTRETDMSYYRYDEGMIHSRNDSHAIVMLSGGIDSTTALTWALYRYDHVRAITMDYNQQHRIEVEYAARTARLMGVEHDIVKVDFPAHFWGIENRLTRGQAGLSAAVAAIAIGHEGADIVLGILPTDNYRDCDRGHLDAVAEVLFHPEDTGGIGIATPLKALRDKADVIALGFEIGAPLMYTWTCRDPDGDRQCMRCPQCVERMTAESKFLAQSGVTADEFSRWQRIPGGLQQPVIIGSEEAGRSLGAVSVRDLELFAMAFINVGGFRSGIKGMVYKDPAGKTRVASKIRDPLALSGLGKKIALSAGEYMMRDMNSVSGFDESGHLWEVCILDDGTVAATETLPDMEVIERAFVRRARG